MLKLQTKNNYSRKKPTEITTLQSMDMHKHNGAGLNVFVSVYPP